MGSEVVIDADKINKQKSTCVNLVYTRRPKKPKTTTPVEPVVTPGIEPIINNDPSSSGQSQPHENGVPLLKEQQQGPLVSLLDDRVKICLKSSTPKPEINNLKGNLEQELEQVRILYRRFEEKENEIEMTRQHQQAQQQQQTVVVVDPAPVVHNHNLDYVYQRQQQAQQSPTLLHYHTPPVTTFNRPLFKSVPLEVGTIKSRLAQNFYKVPTEFAEDVRLTFNNAMSYNPKGHEVYVMAEQLLNIFEDTKGVDIETLWELDRYVTNYRKNFSKVRRRSETRQARALAGNDTIQAAYVSRLTGLFGSMGSYRSKEDDVSKISTSIFVTNFPDTFSAKDLFHSCKTYGHVVDVFIPNKRSNTDRLKFHANIARYHRTPMNANNTQVKNDAGVHRSNTYVFKNTNGDTKDLSNSLLGRVKEFASLSNLKTVLMNEGFVDIKLQYMGELWLIQASTDFTNEGRIVWVEIEGVPIKLWSGNTFKRIASKWGELLDIDDQDDRCFHSKRLCAPDFVEESDDEDQSDDGSKDGSPKVNDLDSCGDDSDVAEVPETVFEESGQKDKKEAEESTGKQENHSEDPFSIYKLLKQKKDYAGNDDKSNQSLKYPPGFTPNEGTDGSNMNMGDSRNDNSDKIHEYNMAEGNSVHNGEGSNKGSKEDISESVCSGHFKKSRPSRTGGSILNLMEELVNVGQTMGYKMDGCLAQKAKKDWVKELCVKNKVNFLALQEIKIENMEIFSVKMCWGNYAFDYVHSDSVGNSGDNDMLIVAVYAPHDLRDKLTLWDYLAYEITKWMGEVVIMDDFNEVHFRSDRFGSVFNAQGASMFNSFIANAGLEEVPLGGSSFTWCHKSATKMSKLDRFFVSDNLMISCPYITAVTLDRYLSDHRPILLRESHFDYGPTPFRYFNYWTEMEGFNKFVEDTWNEAPCDGSNAMINMMKKLKYLKMRIREWNKRNMNNMKNVATKHKEDLEALEARIDKGEGTAEIVNKRMEVVKNLQSIDKLQSLEMAQKAKVKWSIEGDENSSFFHGVLNKKRSQLNIRGIMVDGVWTERPDMVKREFFQHFSRRFDKPAVHRAHIVMTYPKSLSGDQQIELERDVSKEEIKKAVWDCGTDKSPGPDGFSFGFYRHFWKLIENDMFEAVQQFFTNGEIPKGCNSSFIALIPKIPDANLVKDFRPITLIGSMYKIIAKILANRLVGLLGDIVDEVQSAFIADRQILDGPFILNEVLQWCKLKKKQSLIFKVD
ncbi:RNA-directed DNA polymerase, eukaryota, partial [Tanacetum coccineum]